jgi:N4-gp56 family major capsid protein
MTVTSTGSGGLAAVIQSAVQKRVEDNLRAGMPFVLPNGAYAPAVHQDGTSSFTYVSVADIAVSTGTAAVLVEGVPPDSHELQPDHEAFGHAQLGATVTVTDVAEWESPVSLVNVAVERLARNSLEELNRVAREAWEASTNILYINGDSDSAVSATITAADLQRMFATMQDQNIPTFQGINGAPGGLYLAVISPRVALDIQASAATAAPGSWTDIMKYADPSSLITNEIGSAFGFRFVTTSVLSAGESAAAAGSRDLLSSYFLGPSAYALGDAGTLQTTFVGFTPDKVDPLGQLCVMGWKAFWGAKLIVKGGDRLAVLKSCASPLSSAQK